MKPEEFTHLERLLMAWLLDNGYIGIDLTQEEILTDCAKAQNKLMEIILK